LKSPNLQVMKRRLLKCMKMIKRAHVLGLTYSYR
jgi:hypothetical protein